MLCVAEELKANVQFVRYKYFFPENTLNDYSGKTNSVDTSNQPGDYGFFMKQDLFHHQRGMTLIESLVAMVIVAIGLFAILGLQMGTLTDAQMAARQAQAIHLIEDLGERLQVNLDALNNLSQFTQAVDPDYDPDSDPCSSSPCDPGAFAGSEIQIWQQQVMQTIPGSQAQVFVPDGGSRQLGVLIGWPDKDYSIGGNTPAEEENTELKAPFQIEPITAMDGTTIECPDGMICHLQYLQAVQRCAPWTIGGGKLYCPD